MAICITCGRKNLAELLIPGGVGKTLQTHDYPGNSPTLTRLRQNAGNPGLHLVCPRSGKLNVPSVTVEEPVAPPQLVSVSMERRISCPDFLINFEKSSRRIIRKPVRKMG